MTNDCNKIDSFLIVEFKENWSYIRHMEEIRLKHAHIFLIITGVIVSTFSFLFRFSGTNSSQFSFENIITQYKIPIIAASSFIFLYGFFLCIFLAFQKRGYEHYRIVNAQIRDWFTTNYPKQFSFERKLPKRRNAREVIFSTFFYWYLLMVLINVFAFMVLTIVVLALIVPLWSLKWKLLLPIFPSVCIFIFECYIFIKLNQKIEIKPG